LRLPNAFQDYVPDLSIYAVGTIPEAEEEVQVTAVPLCVVEIMSPSQALEEMVGKVNQYFALGVKSVWLVLPAVQNVYVYTAPQEYEIYRATQILKDHRLGVEIDLKQVF
jgi:Uma2 family endonuclease